MEHSNAIPNAFLCMQDQFEDQLEAILNVGSIQNGHPKITKKLLFGKKCDIEFPELKELEEIID